MYLKKKFHGFTEQDSWLLLIPPILLVAKVRPKNLTLGSGEHWYTRWRGEELRLRINISPTVRGRRRFSVGWFICLVAERGHNQRSEKTIPVFVLWQSPTRVQRNLLSWKCVINRATNHIAAVNIRWGEIVIEDRNGETWPTTQSEARLELLPLVSTLYRDWGLRPNFRFNQHWYPF